MVLGVFSFAVGVSAAEATGPFQQAGVSSQFSATVGSSKAEKTTPGANSTHPVINTFSASPTTLPATGGSVELSATVSGATDCVFSSSPALGGLPQTLSCSSGSAVMSVSVPANTATKRKAYKLSLQAEGSKTTKAKINLKEAAKGGSATLAVSASTLSALGGPLMLSARVQAAKATSCVFSVIPVMAGLPAYLPCKSGTATTTVEVPANTGSISIPYAFSLTVTTKKGMLASGPLIVTENAPAPPTISSFAADPPVLSSSGGSFSLKASVFGASSCAFSGPSTFSQLPASVDCLSGIASVTLSAPANTTTNRETYSFDLVATGDGTTDATPFVLTVAGTATPGPIDVCGTLSESTAWSPLLASSYIISSCTVDVTSGVTLTIDPGTVVKASGGSRCLEFSDGYSYYDCSLWVQGTLHAVGTHTSPITFTSVNDNTVGGITGTGSPGSVDWSGIDIDTSGSADIEYATITYAGNPGYTGGCCTLNPGSALQTVGSGGLVMTNDVLANDYGGIGGSPTGSVTISDSTFSDIGPRPAIQVETTNSSVTGDRFNNDSGTPVSISGASSPIVQNNAVTQSTGSGSPAYSVTGPSVDADLLRNNTASGGGPLGFEIGGTLTASSTLDDEAEPWEVSNLDVTSGVTLTIDPGTVVKASGGSRCLEFSDGYSYYDCSLWVQGTLHAVGTHTSPITFTSVNDNTVGGITGTGSPGSVDWSGIDIDTSGSADIEYATITYAGNPGYTGGCCTLNPGSALQTVGSGGLVMTNDVLANDYGGIGGSPTGSVTISDSTFSDIGPRPAIQVETTNSSPVQIDGNLFESNDTAVSISAAADANAQINGDVFDGNAVSIDASSNWSPVDPSCGYLPTMEATGNTYASSSTPLVSQSDYLVIQAASLGLQFPDNWASEVAPGNTDVIQGWSVLPCVFPLDPTIACSVLAVPLELPGTDAFPVACAVDASDSEATGIVPAGAAIDHVVVDESMSASVSETPKSATFHYEPTSVKANLI